MVFFGFILKGLVVGLLLLFILMSNVLMSVVFIFVSMFLNCMLNFGMDVLFIVFVWDFVLLFGFFMNMFGFVVVNSMNKNGVIINVFSFSGGVNVGLIVVNIIVILFVGSFV